MSSISVDSDRPDSAMATSGSMKWVSSSPMPAVRARLAGFLDSGRQGEMQGLPVRRPADLDPGVMATATIIIAAQYVSDMLGILRGLPTGPAHILNGFPFIAARIEAGG